MLVLTIESSHLTTAYCINLLCVCYLVGIYFSIYLLIFFKCLLNAVFCIQLRVSSLIYVPVYIKHTYVNRIWWNKSSQVENFTLQHQSEPDQVIDTTVTKLNKLILCFLNKGAASFSQLFHWHCVSLNLIMRTLPASLPYRSAEYNFFRAIFPWCYAFSWLNWGSSALNNFSSG